LDITDVADIATGIADIGMDIADIGMDIAHIMNTGQLLISG
jgi:hypothetical protein